MLGSSPAKGYRVLTKGENNGWLQLARWTDYYSAEVITETLEMMEEEGRLQVWRDMFKIPEIRRESDSFTLWNESIRRFNGHDMFGRTEPFYQRAKDEVQAH